METRINQTEYLPNLLDESYTSLRNDPPKAYLEFYVSGDEELARTLAELVIQDLRTSSALTDEQILPMAISNYQQGEYLAVIDKYMPELKVRWNVMKEYFAEARAQVLEDHNSDLIDDDDRDFNMRNWISPKGWDDLRRQIREEVKKGGITPRIPL